MINKDNKYYRWYKEIIEFRKSVPPENCYVEVHHILPKSLGGTNEESNLVALTGREHYVCHKLLTKFTEGKAKNKMHWAFHRMIFSKKFAVTSREFEWFKIVHSETMKQYYSDLFSNPEDYAEWSRQHKNKILKSWEDSEARRAATSKRFSKTITKMRSEMGEEAFLAEQRRRSKIGAQKGKEVRQKKVEYYGKIYNGWAEFESETGVSPFLYKKFYLKGINPSFRIGKDGTMTPDEIKTLVELFLEKSGENVRPSNKEEYKTILSRMANVGLITEHTSAQFLNKEFGNG